MAGTATAQQRASDIQEGADTSTGHVQHELGTSKPSRRAPPFLLAIAWCAVSLNFGIQASIVGPSASILAKQIHATESALAPVMGMAGLCTLVGGMPSGWMIDHLPGNALIAVTLLLQAAGFVAMPSCPSVTPLIWVYSTIGFTFNIVNTGLNVMSIWQFTQPHQLAVVLNAMSAAFGLGGMLAPQLVTWALLQGNGKLCYYIVAMTTLFMALAVICLPSPSAPSTNRKAAENISQDTHVQAAAGPSLEVVETANGHHRSLSLDSSQAESAEQEAATLHETQPQDEVQVHRVCPHPDAHYPIESGVFPRQPSPIRHEHEHEQHKAGSPARPELGLSGHSREIWAHSPVHDQETEHAPHEHFIIHTRKPLLETRARVAEQTPTPDLSAVTAMETKPKHAWFVLVPALLVIFANVSIELGFAGWIFMYAKDVGGMEVVAAEGMASLFWTAFTAGRIVAALLAAHVPAASLMALSMPLAVAGAAWALAAPGLPSTAGAVVLIAVGSACGFPCVLSFAAQVIELDGFINGIISTVAGLSATLMPATVPWLAAKDPSRGFRWLMICSLFMAVMQLLFLVHLVWAYKAAKRAASRKQQEKLRTPVNTMRISNVTDELIVPLLVEV